LEHAGRKAEEIGHALNRIMLNTRGPKLGRRLLLQNVVKATMLYGTPVWAHVMQVRSYRRGMQSTYRLGALRVCCGFRTVFDDAALVIAGLVPIDLLATESQVIHTEKRRNHPTQNRQIAKAAREASMSQWPARWDASTKGRWTHRLINGLGNGSIENPAPSIFT